MAIRVQIMVVFWIFTAYSVLLCLLQRFGGTYCFHLQGDWTGSSGCWSHGDRKIYSFPINCHVFPPSLQHPPEQIQPENWGSIFLRNPSYYIPIYTASCLRRLESSTLLRAPQTSYRHAIILANGQWLNFVCIVGWVLWELQQ